MAKISKKQIGRLYGLASYAGLVQSNSKDDAFHNIIYQMFKKDSVKELTINEFYKIEARLQVEVKNINIKTKQSQKNQSGTSGMATRAQKKLIWKKMYELVAVSHESKATVGERLCGIIKKVLDIDAKVGNPFKWVNQKQASTLIDAIKRMIKYESKKNGSA